MKTGVTAFNARIETAAEKPHFKNAVKKRFKSKSRMMSHFRGKAHRKSRSKR
mgnify:CR=1 FL=1